MEASLLLWGGEGVETDGLDSGKVETFWRERTDEE